MAIMRWGLLETLIPFFQPARYRRSSLLRATAERGNTHALRTGFDYTGMEKERLRAAVISGTDGNWDPCGQAKPLPRWDGSRPGSSAESREFSIFFGSAKRLSGKALRGSHVDSRARSPFCVWYFHCSCGRLSIGELPRWRGLNRHRRTSRWTRLSLLGCGLVFCRMRSRWKFCALPRSARF